MPMTPKDITGLVLIAGTLALLVVHGTDRHARPGEPVATSGDTVPIASLTRAASGPEGSEVVFLDVNLIADPDVGPRRHQVVVVHGGTVTAVGPVGTVAPSPDALVVEGAGSDFLLPAVALPSGRAARLDTTRPLTPGLRSDLVLLSADPRIERAALVRPEGLLLRGAWFSDGGPKSPPPPPTPSAGGH